MKILFIRFGKAGDLILLTPVLEVLKKNSIKVSFLVSQKYKEILAGHPTIERFFFIEDGFFNNIRNLRKEKFNLIVDFDKKPLSFFYSVCLFPVKFVRISKNYIRRRMAVWFKIKPGEFHFSDLFYKKVKKTLNLNDPLPLPFLYGEKKFENLPEKYAVFFTGGSHQKKKWPTAYYEKLGRMINDNFDIDIVIMGDKKDREEGNFKEKFFIDLRGKTNWKQTFYIIKNSLFVVSNDTVGVHIADAYRKTIFEIYGSTLPEFGFKPKGKVFIFQTFPKCRPCSLHGEGDCPYQLKCLYDIKPEKVFSKIRDWFSERD